MNRRTTVSAPIDDLATLEREAQRRGVALTVVVAEAVSDKAAQLRTGRQPRVGVARSSDGRSARDVAAEPIAYSPR
ncbi:MAG: hypothetical protein ACJ76L_09210 [Conexibacter sp.]